MMVVGSNEMRTIICLENLGTDETSSGMLESVGGGRGGRGGGAERCGSDGVEDRRIGYKFNSGKAELVSAN